MMFLKISPSEVEGFDAGYFQEAHHNTREDVFFFSKRNITYLGFLTNKNKFKVSKNIWKRASKLNLNWMKIENIPKKVELLVIYIKEILLSIGK